MRSAPALVAIESTTYLLLVLSWRKNLFNLAEADYTMLEGGASAISCAFSATHENINDAIVQI